MKKKITDMMIPLTAPQIEQLKLQGNTAEDWNNVYVAEDFDTATLWRNRFEGRVEIGRLDRSVMHGGELRLREGVYDSRVCDSIIDDGSAVHEVRMLAGYHVRATLYNIGQMTAGEGVRLEADVMNENGGRRIVFGRETTLAEAYMMAKMRDHARLRQRLERLAGDDKFVVEGMVTNCQRIVNSHVRGDGAVVSEAIAVENSVIGLNSKVVRGCIVRNTLIGENVHVEDCARVNDSVVGDNSTIARCEVGNSFIFPAHEQHHNNSFLIAATVMGQSNIAAGATIGSNHNGRTADGELRAGRGFWAGLCTSFKHPSYFASYCLAAKGDYPHELNITLPFALINNNAALDRLEVMPAYWWMYNMYALKRNERKFADRDRRVERMNHIEFAPLAPDTVEEIVQARELLRHWTERAYLSSPEHGDKIEITANGMEQGKRKVVILKAAKAYEAYEQMLYYYIGRVLTAEGRELPDCAMAGKREVRWVNLGGQVMAQSSLDRLVRSIEEGTVATHEEVLQQLRWLFEVDYKEQKCRHAYRLLCDLQGAKVVDEALWQRFIVRYDAVCRYVDEQVRCTREKDDANPFRRMMYDSDEEMHAVLG